MKQKVIYLMTESVKNGVYSKEYKPFTEKEFNKMLKEESSAKSKKINIKKK